MKNIFLLLTFIFAYNITFACDDATFTFNGVTDNGNGTYTYDITICTEMLGLEGIPDWFGFQFSGGSFVSVDSYTPPTLTTSGGDNFNGEIVSANTTVRWRNPAAFPAHNSNLWCNNVTVTTTGYANTIDIYFHDTYGASCNDQYVIVGTPTAGTDTTYCEGETIADMTATAGSAGTLTWYDNAALTSTIGTGATQAPSVIAAGTTTTYYVTETVGGSESAAATVTITINPTIQTITAGAQTPCNSGTNTYTQEVTVTYNAAGSGQLSVNGQLFAITSSPQTVTLTGLTADGNTVNATAFFSGSASCSLTQNALFTAPAACGVSCTPDNGTWD